MQLDIPAACGWEAHSSCHGRFEGLSGEQRGGARPDPGDEGVGPLHEALAGGEQFVRCHESMAWILVTRLPASPVSTRRSPSYATWAPLFSAR